MQLRTKKDQQFTTTGFGDWPKSPSEPRSEPSMSRLADLTSRWTMGGVAMACRYSTPCRQGRKTQKALKKKKTRTCCTPLMTTIN